MQSLLSDFQIHSIDWRFLTLPLPTSSNLHCKSCWNTPGFGLKHIGNHFVTAKNTIVMQSNSCLWHCFCWSDKKKNWNGSSGLNKMLFWKWSSTRTENEWKSHQCPKEQLKKFFRKPAELLTKTFKKKNKKIESLPSKLTHNHDTLHWGIKKKKWRKFQIF